MSEMCGNILCVSSRELTDGIITYSNYSKLVTRGRLDVVRRGGGEDNYSLVRWESLPPRIREGYVMKYGDPAGREPFQAFADMIEDDGGAGRFFASYRFADGSYLAQDAQHKYAVNCKVLDAACRCREWKQEYIHALGGSGSAMQYIAGAVNSLRDKLHHTLPRSTRRLREAMAAYRRDGYASVISGYHHNRNADKLLGPEQESLLRMLMGHYRSLDDAQVCALYNLQAEKSGWKTITGGTVANRRRQWDLYVYAGSRGESAFDNAKQMLARRTAPTMPLLYWTADGWDVELLYQKTAEDKDGHRITTYHNRLTVVVVLDACGKYPVGYAVGDHESSALIREAFRDAVRHTHSLFGEMHTPVQIQTDHYGRGALTAFYESMCDKYTPAKVKNAKAKIIEPYFRYLNRNYCQLRCANWAGYGVKSDMQPNPDVLNKIKPGFPDREGCARQIAGIMEAERALKRAEYVSAYRSLPEGCRHVISEEDYLYRLCERTPRTIRLQPAGICPAIDGVRRYYDCFDPDFRLHAHEDWTVHYDPADAKRVLVSGREGRLRYVCEEKHVQPMALAERGEGDAGELARVRHYNKELKARVLDTIEDDYGRVSGLLAGRDEETLSKLLITDSGGRHKDRRNAARLQEAGRRLLERAAGERGRGELRAAEERERDYIRGRVDISGFIDED